MNKELILLIFVFVLLFYIIIKSIIFYKKFKINPVAFAQGKFLDNLSWHLIVLVLILYGVEIILLYFGKINLVLYNKNLDIMGYIVLLLGFAVMVAAHTQMGKSWRIGNDNKNKTKLVNSGLFKYSRNPVYVGLIFQGIAVLLLIPNLFSLILVIALIIIFNSIIRQEEKFLEKQFGKEYLNYKLKVRRFI